MEKDNIYKAFKEHCFSEHPFTQDEWEWYWNFHPAQFDTFKAGYKAAKKKQDFNLDAFGGWLIEMKAPTSVLEKFREARKGE